MNERDRDKQFDMPRAGVLAYILKHLPELTVYELGQIVEIIRKKK